MVLQETIPAGDALGDKEMLRCCICCHDDDAMLDPLLLDCLHSCCAQHAAAAVEAAAAAAAVEATLAPEQLPPPQPLLLLCTVCNEATGLCGSEPRQMQEQLSNCFLAGRVRRQLVLSGRATCAGCTPAAAAVGEQSESTLTDGLPGPRQVGDVEYICQTCRMLLCNRCMLDHEKVNSGGSSKHLVIDLDDADLALIAEPTCWQHAGMPYDRLCFTCGGLPKCVLCAPACAIEGHSLCALPDAAAAQLASSARQELASLDRCLRARDLHRDCQKLENHLVEARAAQRAKLRANKVAVLQALDGAFTAAELALESCYETSLIQVAELAKATGQLSSKLRQALGYTGALLPPAEEASLLMQRRQLAARLHRLEADAGHAADMLDGAAAAMVVTIKNELPAKEALDKVLRSWIGVPTVARVPVFDLSKPRTIKASVSCYDVALAADGRVLLAALENGMKEYDMASGEELSSWKPPDPFEAQEGVQTVDALEDGRVFAGLSGRPHVALLRRTSSQAATDVEHWVEERCITAMRSPPFHLSVLSDLLAVVEGELGERGHVCPGRQLVLISVSRNEELHRSALKYRVCCVAATASGVVTASDKSFGGHYRVDCFSQRGEPWWTACFDDYVTDICSCWSGRVLYVAECGSGTVFALCGRKQAKLEDLAAVFRGSSLRPYKLSSRGLLQPLLAVLSKDFRTVVVFGS